MTDLIANVVVRDEESPLQTAVDDHEGVELEIQSSAADEGTVAPCARVYGPPSSIDAVDASLAAEPTVESHRRLDDDDDGGEGSDRRFYRIEWTDRCVLDRLVEHDGSVLSATLDANGWDVRLLFPSHADLSAAYATWETDRWTVYVKRITPSEEERMAAHDLSDEQHRAMKRAVETGYYRVPRRITLAELAADLDVSHQALSERLRRASRNLVTETFHGLDDSEEEPPEAADPAFDE